MRLILDLFVCWSQTHRIYRGRSSSSSSNNFLSGKTILLALQGLRWLAQGHDVHVVSTWLGALAASVQLEHQLQLTQAADSSRYRGTVFFHHYDFYSNSADVDRAVRELTSAVRGKDMYILIDEANLQKRLVFTAFE
jgi:hypothetical protein